MSVSVEPVTTPVSVENLIQEKNQSALPFSVPHKQKMFDTWTTLLLKDKAPAYNFRKQATLADQQGPLFQLGRRDACP